MSRHQRPSSSRRASGMVPRTRRILPSTQLDGRQQHCTTFTTTPHWRANSTCFWTAALSGVATRRDIVSLPLLRPHLAFLTVFSFADAYLSHLRTTRPMPRPMRRGRKSPAIQSLIDDSILKVPRRGACRVQARAVRRGGGGGCAHRHAARPLRRLHDHLRARARRRPAGARRRGAHRASTPRPTMSSPPR